MNIVVCVKQVPATTEVKMDKETNTIIREGVEAIINPYDMYAVEEGIRIKERLGGKVTVLSMGIPSVAELLKTTIGLGADDAVLLSDRAFAGADTLSNIICTVHGHRKDRERGSGDLWQSRLQMAIPPRWDRVWQKNLAGLILPM